MDRIVDKWSKQILGRIGRSGRFASQGAVSSFDAVAGELVEGAPHAGKRLDLAFENILARVDCAVENHRADPVRKLLRIDRAQTCSVAGTEERQLLVAERRAQDIEISGHVLGTHLSQDFHTAAASSALIENRAGRFRAPGQRPSGNSGHDGVIVSFLVGVAVDGRLRAPDSAWIHRYDVEVFACGTVPPRVCDRGHESETRGSRAPGLTTTDPTRSFPVARMREIPSSMVGPSTAA